MNKVIKDTFFKQILNILKIYMIFIVIYHFYQKERKLKNAIKSYAIYMIKKLVVHIRALKQALNLELVLKKYIE